MSEAGTKNEIVVYQPNGSVRLEVCIGEKSVWLTQAQMCGLFQRDVSVISRHIRNVFAEGEVDRESNLHFLQIPNSDRPIAVYTKHYAKRLALDVRRHNEQYAPIAVKPYRGAHDRFLIADSAVYHVGASLKDLGKSLFAFSRLVTPASAILAQVEKG